MSFRQSEVTATPGAVAEIVQTHRDIEALRDVGFSDEQIFAMTVYVSLRIAFSTVNASLGAHPDAALGSTVPDAVLDAVTYGRPIQSPPTVP